MPIVSTPLLSAYGMRNLRSDYPPHLCHFCSCFTARDGISGVYGRQNRLLIAVGASVSFEDRAHFMCSFLRDRVAFPSRYVAADWKTMGEKARRRSSDTRRLRATLCWGITDRLRERVVFPTRLVAAYMKTIG
jgi:hypothetical protein